ncbi:winged helix-turn-helix domain-containing protein [Streptomyces sp. NPDC015220]|uniref:winged helix-turn-helix domain-containing protein n=1 Tax=Streptomyces sp. NPDC015220 TaxID=3364947 RepID=UPI00370135A1
MVYRIHFTVEDLARTRVGQPPPLMELGAAARILQDRGHPVRFGAWRQAARAALAPEARMVLDLIPPGGWAPTFLTSTCVRSPEESLEQVRTTTRSQIREDLAHVAEWQPLPAWAHHLADDPDLLRQLYESLDHVCAVLLAPNWSHITGAAAADRAVRMRQALTGGMEALLSSLNPRRIRWSPPVLEVAMLSGFDGDLRLGGRGLLLVPSVFGAGAPAIDIDAEPQPVLRYPVGRDHPSDPTPWFPLPAHPAVPPGGRSPLAALLGRTRAAVLHTIAEHPGCSTRELALFTGLAPASASEHATTLRAAGLIHTVRQRNAVLHSPTALGISLLNSPPGLPPL